MGSEIGREVERGVGRLGEIKRKVKRRVGREGGKAVGREREGSGGEKWEGKTGEMRRKIGVMRRKIAEMRRKICEILEVRREMGKGKGNRKKEDKCEWILSLEKEVRKWKGRWGKRGKGRENEKESYFNPVFHFESRWKHAKWYHSQLFLVGISKKGTYKTWFLDVQFIEK